MCHVAEEGACEAMTMSPNRSHSKLLEHAHEAHQAVERKDVGFAQPVQACG